MNIFKKFKNEHPDIWEFILFNILSNCATITNFAVMWICTGVIFAGFKTIPFRWLIFNYTAPESLMLCGFLSFLLATAVAQMVNFFVQKNLVFKSDVQFQDAIGRYIILVVMLIVISAALPAYSQKLAVGLGIPEMLAPTLANIVNILVQVVISYPAMKFWIMPKRRMGASKSVHNQS